MFLIFFYWCSHGSKFVTLQTSPIILGHFSLRTDQKAYISANKTKLIWTEMEVGLRWNVFFTRGRHTPDVDIYALVLCFFQSKCSNFSQVWQKASTLWALPGRFQHLSCREIRTSAPSMTKPITSRVWGKGAGKWGLERESIPKKWFRGLHLCDCKHRRSWFSV